MSTPVIEIRKYRLYPKPEQIASLEETLESCRRTWNFLLSKRKQFKVSKFEQDHDIYLRKQSNVHLKRVYSHVLQNVSDRLDKSFVLFYRRLKCEGQLKRKDGMLEGYPRFKSFGRYDSFTYPDAYNGSVKLGISLRKTKIYLSKIGYVPIFVHREPSNGRNKRCTVKREGDKWFAILEYQVADVSKPSIAIPKDPVGLDFGLLSIVATSGGETFKPAIPLKKHLKRLQHLQRSLSRKRKGSKNRRKAIVHLGRFHWKIRSVRSDFNHKLSRSIVSRHDFFTLEDLNVRGMIKNHNLDRSISDAGWNQLSRFIKYKAEREGKQVVLVSPYHTSTDCSRCGYRQEMPLSVRTFHCERCGLEMDRDVNSAHSVLKRGLSEIGVERSESKPMEIGVQSLNRWEIQPIEEVGIVKGPDIHEGGSSHKRF